MTPKGKVCALLLVGAALSSGAANAGLVIEYQRSIPPTATPWNMSATVPQFDPSNGTLLRVEFDISAQFDAQMRVENLDEIEAARVRLDLTWSLTLKEPGGGGTYATAEAQRIREPLLDPYDGSLDYAGASGRTYTFASVSAADSQTLTDPSDLAEYTGVGMIDLPLMAMAMLAVTPLEGSTNFDTQAPAGASATVIVRYVYIPEPGSIGLWFLGILSTMFRRRPVLAYAASSFRHVR